MLEQMMDAYASVGNAAGLSPLVLRQAFCSTEKETTKRGQMGPGLRDRDHSVRALPI